MFTNNIIIWRKLGVQNQYLWGIYRQVRWSYGKRSLKGQYHQEKKKVIFHRKKVVDN